MMSTPTGGIREDGAMTEVDPDGQRAASVRELEASFGELITHFRRLVMHNADLVSPGMLPGAYKVFTTIARNEGMTVSVLADRMMIDKGQMSRTVRELEALDLIERTPDPTDRRSSVLALTPHGLARLAAARIPQEGMLLETVHDWETTEIDNLSRLLRDLTVSVDRRVRS